MIQTIDDLAQIAAELPMDQRYTLAQRILASVEPAHETDCENAWTTEISQRIKRYDAGETHGIPAAQVFVEIEQKLAQ
ncbi:MAG: addiction module protein [Verrucomicrobiota bacterium]